MIKLIFKAILSESKRIKIRLLLNRFTSILYFGNKFSCNCCGKKFRKFLNKGISAIRKNAVCPYCGSLERTRLLLFYLQQETNIFIKKAKLLHFAPEWCLIPFFKESINLTYITGDINPNYAEHIIDIMNIRYPDNYFDYIICSHVLGHVSDEPGAIKELYRVLKQDGLAIIMTVINWKSAETYENALLLSEEERIRYYTEPDLLRLHGADFINRLTKGGFKVEMINYAEKLGKEFHIKYSLGNGDREMVFKCTKY